jgi:hypothetical protein
MDWTFVEQGFLCCVERSFDLEPPRTVWKCETEWELEEISRGESWKSIKAWRDSGGIALWRPSALEWSNWKLNEWLHDCNSDGLTVSWLQFVSLNHRELATWKCYTRWWICLYMTRGKWVRLFEVKDVSRNSYPDGYRVLKTVVVDWIHALWMGMQQVVDIPRVE